MTYEILASAREECGEEFHGVLKRWLVKQFRRKDEKHLEKPDKKVNLEIIRILREISVRCTPHPQVLKVFAPDGKDPRRWAQSIAVQLARFCDRVYRVWQQLGSPPLEKICFIPTIQVVFRSECSLDFPRDICVAQEAIERAEKSSRRLKQHKLNRRGAKSARRL